MPTYEYACTSCDNHWEEVQKISEPAIEICPKCSQKTAKRQISGGNFILKGGGWYADLYSSSKKPSEAPKADSAANGSGTAASSSSSAAKPEGTKSPTSPAPPGAPGGSSGSGSGSGSGSK
jgi:putative FmdB family regulatory protein